MLAPVDGEPTCSLWFVATRPEGPTIARKATFPAARMIAEADPFKLRIADAELTDSGMSGAFEDVAWDLTWAPGKQLRARPPDAAPSEDRQDRARPSARRRRRRRHDPRRPAPSCGSPAPTAARPICGAPSTRPAGRGRTAATSRRSTARRGRATSSTASRCIVPRLGREVGPSTPVVGRLLDDDFLATSPLAVLRAPSRFALTSWSFEATAGKRRVVGRGRRAAAVARRRDLQRPRRRSRLLLQQRGGLDAPFGVRSRRPRHRVDAARDAGELGARALRVRPARAGPGPRAAPAVIERHAPRGSSALHGARGKATCASRRGFDRRARDSPAGPWPWAARSTASAVRRVTEPDAAGAGGRRRRRRPAPTWLRRCSSPTACRSRSRATESWRCCTPAGAGWPAGIVDEGVRAVRELGAEARCRPRWDRARGRAATRSATTFARPSAPRSRNLDLPASPPRSCALRVSRRSTTAALCTICDEPASSATARRRDGGAPGRSRVAGPDRTSASRATSTRSATRSPRRPAGATSAIMAAVKYLAVEELDALAEGGVTAGRREPRPGARASRRALIPSWTWDFIGQLQSRKVKQVLPLVSWIHSVASDSVLAQLGRHAAADTEVLVEVNVAREEGKSGVAPDDLDGLPRPLSGAGGRPDDDAAVRRAARGEPALVRRAARARRASTACPSCRWAPRRTTSSPSRRAPRSCASARACTARREYRPTGHPLQGKRA